MEAHAADISLRKTGVRAWPPGRLALAPSSLRFPFQPYPKSEAVTLAELTSTF